MQTEFYYVFNRKDKVIHLKNYTLGAGRLDNMIKCSAVNLFFYFQSKDHQEYCDGEYRADGRAVEAEIWAREGEEQDSEEHRHLAGEWAQSLEKWWSRTDYNLHWAYI